MNQKIKQTILAVIIIVIAFVVFKVFFAPADSGDTALLADKNTSVQVADGQMILVLLNKLKNVNLDTDIFSNNIFNSLVSFEKPIADQVVGRPNPFLPIGVDGSGLVLPKSTSTIATSSRR